MSYANEKIFEKIVNKGNYYSPATKHYPDKPNCTVNCDKCGKIKLKQSLGWDKYDLCMDCVTRVTEIINKEQSNDESSDYISFMLLEQYYVNPLSTATLMCPGDYIVSKPIRTFDNICKVIEELCNQPKYPNIEDLITSIGIKNWFRFLDNVYQTWNTIDLSVVYNLKQLFANTVNSTSPNKYDFKSKISETSMAITLRPVNSRDFVLNYNNKEIGYISVLSNGCLKFYPGQKAPVPQPPRHVATRMLVDDYRY